MSASLVGSEMCIRDRSLWAWRRCVRRREPGGGGRANPERPTAPGCPSACLLYTSDAADDM
eukprot:7069138-Alexandrium_andersonii.AAC.1